MDSGLKVATSILRNCVTRLKEIHFLPHFPKWPQPKLCIFEEKVLKCPNSSYGTILGPYYVRNNWNLYSGVLNYSGRLCHESKMATNFLFFLKNMLHFRLTLL